MAYSDQPYLRGPYQKITNPAPVVVIPEAWGPELAKWEELDSKLEQFLRDNLKNYNNGFKFSGFYTNYQASKAPRVKVITSILDISFSRTEEAKLEKIQIKNERFNLKKLFDKLLKPETSPEEKRQQIEKFLDRNNDAAHNKEAGFHGDITNLLYYVTVEGDKRPSQEALLFKLTKRPSDISKAVDPNILAVNLIPEDFQLRFRNQGNEKIGILISSWLDSEKKLQDTVGPYHTKKHIFEINTPVSELQKVFDIEKVPTDLAIAFDPKKLAVYQETFRSRKIVKAPDNFINAFVGKIEGANNSGETINKFFDALESYYNIKLIDVGKTAYKQTNTGYFQSQESLKAGPRGEELIFSRKERENISEAYDKYSKTQKEKNQEILPPSYWIRKKAKTLVSVSELKGVDENPILVPELELIMSPEKYKNQIPKLLERIERDYQRNQDYEKEVPTNYNPPSNKVSPDFQTHNKGWIIEVPYAKEIDSKLRSTLQKNSEELFLKYTDSFKEKQIYLNEVNGVKAWKSYIFGNISGNDHPIKTLLNEPDKIFQRVQDAATDAYLSKQILTDESNHLILEMVKGNKRINGDLAVFGFCVLGCNTAQSHEYGIVREEILNKMKYIERASYNSDVSPIVPDQIKEYKFKLKNGETVSDIHEVPESDEVANNTAKFNKWKETAYCRKIACTPDALFTAYEDELETLLEKINQYYEPGFRGGGLGLNLDKEQRYNENEYPYEESYSNGSDASKKGYTKSAAQWLREKSETLVNVSYKVGESLVKDKVPELELIINKEKYLSEEQASNLNPETSERNISTKLRPRIVTDSFEEWLNKYQERFEKAKNAFTKEFEAQGYNRKKRIERLYDKLEGKNRDSQNYGMTAVSFFRHNKNPNKNTIEVKEKELEKIEKFIEVAKFANKRPSTKLKDLFTTSQQVKEIETSFI